MQLAAILASAKQRRRLRHEAGRSARAARHAARDRLAAPATAGLNVRQEKPGFGPLRCAATIGVAFFMQIHTVQTVRKIVLLLAILLGVLVFAFTETITPSGHIVHETIEWIGVALIVVCILGRTWSSLYIGGRKVDELVMVGPYSVCRNPLYFFSVIGAAGMGAQTGSVVIGLTCGVIAALVFRIVVGQEEKFLLQKYGERFREYLGRVPRLFPNTHLWHDVEILHVRPRSVVLTFADASFFLLAIPIAEFFELLQRAGIIPILLRLP